jgi:hypothetical protein
MTAHTSHQPSGRYRFRQLARMEWIKLRGLRSTWLTLAIAVAASAGIALATGSSTTSGGMFVSNTLVGMLIGASPVPCTPWSIPGSMHTWFCVTQLCQVALL